MWGTQAGVRWTDGISEHGVTVRVRSRSSGEGQIRESFVQLEPQIRFEKERRGREGRRLRARKKDKRTIGSGKEVAEVAAIMRTLAQVSGLFL